jgi:chromosome segregation ATPase
LLLAADYRFVWFDGLNRFYVAAEKMELAAAFQVQPNVFDGFVRHNEAEAFTLKAEIARLATESAEVNVQLAKAQSSLTDAVTRDRQANDALRGVQDELAAHRHREDELKAEIVRLATESAAVRVQLAEAQSSLTDAVARERQANDALRAAQDELAAQRNRQDELKAENVHRAAERDVWMQELFEVNRHAAYLAQERQTLLERHEAEKARIYAGSTWRFILKLRRVEHTVRRPVRAVAKLLGRR